MILAKKIFYRNWRDVTSLKINDPVTDIAFAPSAGRSYHMLAIASKDISIYKITEVNKRMDDEMFDTGEPIEYETTLIESLEGSSQSTMEVNYPIYYSFNPLFFFMCKPNRS